MQHQLIFCDPLEVLETKHRPIKRQKVTSKVKRKDENSLSAAAIVDAISLATKKGTNDRDLSYPKVSCECGTSLT